MNNEFDFPFFISYMITAGIIVVATGVVWDYCYWVRHDIAVRYGRLPKLLRFILKGLFFPFKCAAFVCIVVPASIVLLPFRLIHSMWEDFK